MSRSILLLACVLVAGNASSTNAADRDGHGPQRQHGDEHGRPRLRPRPPPDTAPATFRSNVDLVALNVVVTDSEQKYVAGLRPSDFSVFEDGIQQDVSFFGASDIPTRSRDSARHVGEHDRQDAAGAAGGHRIPRYAARRRSRHHRRHQGRHQDHVSARRRPGGCEAGDPDRRRPAAAPRSTTALISR